MKNLFVLALGIALLSASAGTHAEDAPLHPVLTVTEWTQDWEDLVVTVENPGEATEQGVLVVWFYARGSLTGWGVPMTVPPLTLVTVGLRLTDGGAVLGSPLMYSDDPAGITDAPDPVMREVEPSNGDKKNGKGKGNEDPPPTE